MKDERGRLQDMAPPHSPQRDPDDVAVSRYVRLVDPATSFLRKPHTISFLVLAGLVTVHHAFSREGLTLQENIRTGLLSAALCFLLFSVLQMRDGLFIRPHRALWRLVMGMAVLYLLALVFLLFQTVDDARMMLSLVDPELGKPIGEQVYAADCRVFTPDDADSNFRNIRNAVEDPFFVAHLIGWWGKALVIRDAHVCWALSITFELFEFSLRHWLPNFKECWWDHVVLDILLCNGIGIWLGMQTCRYLQMKEYDWAGMGRAKRVILRSITQFSPEKYDVFQWEIFSSPKRVLAVMLLVIMWASVELNTFFLKNCLWVPPPHPVVVGRLWLWWWICFPALREYYQFVTDPTCHQFGTMAWLSVAILATEGLINVKFGRGLYTAPTPPFIFWGWVTAGVVFSVWFSVFCWWKWREGTRQVKKE